MMNVNTAPCHNWALLIGMEVLYLIFSSKSLCRMLNAMLISTKDIFSKLPLIFLMVDTDKTDTNKTTVQSHTTAPPAD